MYLICHVTSHDQFMEGAAIYGWKFLPICHHRDKFCDYKHCHSGGILFLICHVISSEHMFEGYLT